MDRKEYKQAFDRERYERIELKVPKGKALSNLLLMTRECLSMRICKTSSEKTSAECLTRCRLQRKTEK